LLLHRRYELSLRLGASVPAMAEEGFLAALVGSERRRRDAAAAIDK
jgi:hypothetical protein